MSALLLRASVVFALIGMLGGIIMGIKADFQLAPAHAHLNLLGFVALFLSGLYYRIVPEAASGWLANAQALLSVAGAILLPIGIVAVTVGDHDRYFPVVAIGSIIALLGMALFAVIVFRTAGERA